jgi:TP901 family phage tail tape measure protein
MPNVQRTVSTLLKIDGEQQYKAVIANINREQATLKASIALVDAQFKGQANSMAALTEKSRIYAQQQTLITRSLNASRGMYESAKQAVLKYTAEVDKLRAKIASEGDAEGKLGKQLSTAQANLQGAQNATESYRKKVIEAEARLYSINDAIKTNAKYMDEARKSTDGTASSIDKYGKEVKTAGEESQRFGEKGSAAFQQLASALMAAGLIRGMEELVDLFIQCAKASIEFETAFTGVLKTVEGTPEQLAAINDQIKEMATRIPLTTTEIANIAAVAGQLGIATNDVARFTEVMAALGVSTNLSSTDAATTLARFAKVTGLDSSQYENLGSAIVALGNNSATTEAEIVDMGMGIAAAGTQVGMTQAEILAFSAALSSAGMDTQAGGTAISRTLVEMSLAAQTGSKDLDKFAKVAGMSSEEFAKLFNSSATDAFTKFIAGLSSGGSDAISVLNEMGITEIRQRDAMLRLANATGLLTSSLAISTSAFAENTALAEESGKFYATTESKTVLLKNAVNALGVTIGDQFNPALRRALETGTDVVKAIDEYLQKNPGMTAAMTGFATALGVVAVSIAGVNVVVSILIPAIKAFGAAMTTASGPVGIVIVALAALTAGLLAASAAVDTNTEKYDALIESNKKLLDELESSKGAYEDRIDSINSEASAVDGLIQRLDDLLGTEAENRVNSAKIKDIVGQLNAAVSGLGLTYNELTGTMNMSTDAIRTQTQAMFDQKLQIAFMDRRVQATVDLAYAEHALEETQASLTSAFYDQKDAMIHVRDASGHMYDVPTKKSQELGKEIETLTEQETEQQKRVDELSGEYDWLTDQIIGASDATSDASDSMSGANPAIDGLNSALQPLVTAWNNYRDAISGVLEQLDVFTKLNTKPEETTSGYTKTVESNTQVIEDYTDNLTKLNEMHLNPILLRELAENPTEENMQRAAALASSTQEQIDALNTSLDEYNGAMDTLAETSAGILLELDGLIEDFQTQIGELVDSMGVETEAYTSGANLMVGMMNGIKLEEPELYQLIEGIIANLQKMFSFNITNGANVGGLTLPSGKVIPHLYWIPQSHKTGIDYVPYDDYYALLHEGERVLTKEENALYSSPTAEQMTRMPRSITRRDIEAAFGSVSTKGGDSFTSNNYFTNANPSPSEIAREERRSFKRMRRNL